MFSTERLVCPNLVTGPQKSGDSGRGKRARKYLWGLALVFALPLVLLACPVPGGGGGGGSNNNNSTSYTFSGTVVDALTGQPVAGATVVYSTFSATSAADGTFSMNLGTGTSVLSGGYGVYATGYQFLYATPITLTPTSNLNLKLALMTTPSNYATYPTHNVHGQI